MFFFENYLLYSVHVYKNLTDYDPHDPYDDLWNGSDEGDTPIENGRIQKFLYGSDEGDTPSGNGKIEFFTSGLCVTVSDLRECIKGMQYQLKAMQRQNMYTLQRMYTLEMQHYRRYVTSDFSVMPQALPMPSMGSPMPSIRSPMPSIGSPMPVRNMWPDFDSHRSPGSTDLNPGSTNGTGSSEIISTVSSTSASCSSSATTSDTSTISKKEKEPLPPIDKSTLINPQDVTEKYHCFLKRSKLTRLAVRLVKESFSVKR